MIVIRLSWAGTKKSPFYRIMVAEKRKPRDGRFIERVGYYNPMARGLDLRLQIETERVNFWLSKGAKASDRVQHLLKTFEKSPQTAQKAGPRKKEMKKAQQQQAAQKTRLTAKTSENTDNQVASAEASSDSKE